MILFGSMVNISLNFRVMVSALNAEVDDYIKSGLIVLQACVSIGLTVLYQEASVLSHLSALASLTTMIIHS